MSGGEVIALAAVVVSGVVGVASLGFNFWNSHQERHQRLAERRDDSREWYRRTLFERRLKAIQEGTKWLNRMWDVMYHPYAGSGVVPINDALGWYESDIVIIHGGPPGNNPLGAFLYATRWALEESDPVPDEDLWFAAREFLTQKADEILKESQA